MLVTLVVHSGNQRDILSTTMFSSVSNDVVRMGFPQVFKDMSQKILVAFDFDHTIIEENSDLFVRRLAPGGKLPQEIKAMYRDNDWTEYMAAIFKHLHLNGTTPEEIYALMREIPFVKGMEQLFGHLASDTFEIIIISDANSVFIDCIMTAAGLNNLVKETYTNPAWFSEEGCLQIKYYHTQDWCQLSTKNLCKGYILEKHIKTRQSRGIEFSTVIYIGDGSNDLCPGLKLRNNDVLMPRKEFKLMQLLEANTYSELKAQVVPWSDGHDILAFITKRST